MTYSDNLIKELQTLYPKYKVPFNKEQEYYLNLQMDDTLPYILDSLLELENQVAPLTISKYKLQKMDEILLDFKESRYTETLKNLDFAFIDSQNLDLNTNEFGNFKTDKVYLSVDLVQANWNTFKKYTGLNSPLAWDEYMVKYNLHESIAKSKTFRQYVLGNTYPSRLQKLSLYEIVKVKNKLLSELNDLNIVSTNADELILEFNSLSFETLSKITNILHSLKDEIKTKISVFGIQEVKNNFGDFVRIKREYNSPNMIKCTKIELRGVPGNRYFLHYKTLIKQQELDDRDLVFLQDKKLAKWII